MSSTGSSRASRRCSPTAGAASAHPAERARNDGGAGAGPRRRGSGEPFDGRPDEPYHRAAFDPRRVSSHPIANEEEIMIDSTDLFDIVHTTRAMRRLKPDPVPDELIAKILQAGVCAANGGNTQRWRF